MYDTVGIAMTSRPQVQVSSWFETFWLEKQNSKRRFVAIYLSQNRIGKDQPNRSLDKILTLQDSGRFQLILLI